MIVCCIGRWAYEHHEWWWDSRIVPFRDLDDGEKIGRANDDTDNIRCCMGRNAGRSHHNTHHIPSHPVGLFCPKIT